MKVLTLAHPLSTSLLFLCGAALAACAEPVAATGAGTKVATAGVGGRPVLASAQADEPRAADADEKAAADDASAEETPAEPKETEAGAESPWTPPKLETGFDLSKVKVVAKPAPAPGQTTAAQPQRPAVATGTYTGGGPSDEDLETNGEVGYLTVSEDGAIHDFGGLTQGDVVEHTFELVTVGTAPVEISQIKTSCGCTVAQTRVVGGEGEEPKPYAMGAPLPPNSRVLVGAKLDTKGKRSRVRSVVTVMSSDPRGNMQLQLMADVVPFFEVTPLSLNFGTLKPDQVVEKELTVTSPSAGFYALSVNDEALPDELAVRLEPVEPREDGRAATWKVHVTLGPNIPEGPRRNYQVILKSDQVVENAQPLPTGEMPTHQTIAYAVVSVLGMVSATPHYMSFGLMREGQEISRSVTIENHDDAFEMARPEVTLKGYSGDFEYPDNATIEVTPLAEGNGYEVMMTMRAPDGLTGTFRGMVVVQVGHPTKPTLELPFTGVVRSQGTRPQPPKQPAAGGASGHEGHDHGPGGHGGSGADQR